ncbi:MAG: hypothetical protein R3E31_17670 [Chloroflexota bacterium]|nr:hypothetical protein [Anaerolineales bacterium]MCA9977960.1 hypothetical protein [Anaerolineales bacterium]MCB8966805.1 hypothetical protein [Ardenticatenaceae bacterium]
MSIQNIHGEVRWLVVILAVVIIIKFAIGWLRKQDYNKTDRILMSAFVGFIDVNLLLGLILFLQRTVDYTRLFEHVGIMLTTVVLAHTNAAWKNQPSAIKFRNNLFLIIAVLALVFLGVVRVRGSFLYDI